MTKFVFIQLPKTDGFFLNKLYLPSDLVHNLLTNAANSRIVQIESINPFPNDKF